MESCSPFFILPTATSLRYDSSPTPFPHLFSLVLCLLPHNRKQLGVSRRCQQCVVHLAQCAAYSWCHLFVIQNYKKNSPGKKTGWLNQVCLYLGHNVFGRYDFVHTPALRFSWLCEYIIRWVGILTLKKMCQTGQKKLGFSRCSHFSSALPDANDANANAVWRLSLSQENSPVSNFTHCNFVHIPNFSNFLTIWFWSWLCLSGPLCRIPISIIWTHRSCPPPLHGRRWNVPKPYFPWRF